MDEDNGVDVAEMVKQHAALGEEIVKLGGKLKYPENDDSNLKAKKSVERVKLSKGKKAPPADDEEDPEDMLDGGADEAEEDAGGKKVKKADEKVEKTEKKTEKVEKGADETVEFNGQTISKAAVGDVQFSIFKGMVTDLNKAKQDIAKAEDDALMARLEKRAGDDFSHVPGSVTERASMLKAVAGMSDDLKKSFEAVFAVSEKLAKSAFDTIGKGGGDTDDIKKSKQDFEGKVSEVAKRDNIGRADALTKVRKEFPDLFKAYQAAN